MTAYALNHTINNGRKECGEMARRGVRHTTHKNRHASTTVAKLVETTQEVFILIKAFACKTKVWRGKVNDFCSQFACLLYSDHG